MQETEDVAPLLPAGVRFDDGDAMASFEQVWATLIACMKGGAWKLTERGVTELRRLRYPMLLRQWLSSTESGSKS